ncbi:hypothetical protein GNY06_05635 [Elizabethkingia argentiflava]|uniref:SAM-dependent chlorinase/fluorinase n=1 Tax=Elizabethkingia argenteiflava TaxID=2681556 RepID=A0A845PTB4_9FLAO|nr:SAM-dependent chlorinase/fluorinase [Elizabethkingia argenteiflava]NAW50875.1 hypothetical protein [Elizabethkingia argenteiflava]
MSIITLTSDYGILDYRVAAIKGSIYSQLINAQIVDITHQIQTYNLQQTAYIVRSVYKYYPQGSIHIISVDSFHHKNRKNIIAKVDGHYFICADNGLLSLLFFDINPEEIYEITLGNRFDDKVNFTSTDIFAPVAVHLAKGGVPEVVGKKITKIKENSFARAIFNEAEGIMVGEVMYVDNFGNAISNISRKFFNNSLKSYHTFKLKFRNFQISKINNYYTDVVENWEDEPLYHGSISAIFNENNLLEIAIYKGSYTNGASSLLGLTLGERIFVEFG